MFFFQSTVVALDDAVPQRTHNLLVSRPLGIMNNVFQFVAIFPHTLKVKVLFDWTGPLHYFCYVMLSHALSHQTSSSHAVKNTLQSKEETDNTAILFTYKALSLQIL